MEFALVTMFQTNVLEYDCFHVLAKNIKDKTYYVGWSKDSTSEIVDYCWCNTNGALNVEKIIRGYLSMPPSYNPKKLPMLVVSN